MKKKIINDEDKSTITVSIDRIKLTLERYRNAKSIIGELISYFGLILSLVITLLTSKFKDVWIFSAESLNVIFIVLLAVFILVFCIKLIQLVYLKHKGNISEEWFIDTIQYKEKAPKLKNPETTKNIITFIILFILIIALPIGLFIGLGFIFNWHWAYCIFGGIFLFSACMTLWSEWENFSNSIYNWLCKFNKKDD